MTALAPVSAAASDRPWDNLLGICACLGEDLGFNPLYLRIALAGGLLWNPWAMVGAYAAAGVVVLATRLLFPNPRRAAAPADRPVVRRIEADGYVETAGEVPLARAA